METASTSTESRTEYTHSADPVSEPVHGPMEAIPNVSTASSPELSEKNQTKALLAEARNTRDMLVAFRSAVESGSYHGAKMLDLAKGLAFVDAILNQNQAHIHNLQERLGK